MSFFVCKVRSLLLVICGFSLWVVVVGVVVVAFACRVAACLLSILKAKFAIAVRS